VVELLGCGRLEYDSGMKEIDVDAQVAADAAELAELDRRWAAIEGGEPTVPHEEVARWPETWGTPAFKPWHER